MKFNKTGLRISTFVLNAFWRSLFVLNAFLAALFVFQAAVLSVVFWNFRMSLPDWLSDRVQDEIEKMGLVVGFASATIDFKGNLSLDSVEARFNGTPENFFKARRVCASFRLAPLLFGEVSLKSLRVLDGRLGPTYEDIDKKPIVKSLYLDIDRRGQWWRVNALNMRLGKLSVDSSGFVNSNFDPDEIFGVTPPESAAVEPQARASGKIEDKMAFAARKFDAVMSRYPELKRRVDMLKDPMLDLSFSLFGGGENFASINLASGGVVFDLGGAETEIKNFRIRADYDGTSDGGKAVVQVWAENFLRRDFPSFQNVDARADVFLDGNYWHLEDVDLAVKSISYDGTEIGNVWLRKKFLDVSNWRDNWRVFASLDMHRFGGEFSVGDDMCIDFSFDGRIDPVILLSRPELAGIEELRHFKFPDGVELVGGGKIMPRSGSADLRLGVRAVNCLIMDIPVASASGRVSFATSEGVLRAENLKVESAEGWGVRGAYIQNMGTAEYRVRVEGDIRPMAISHFMEKWWERIMKNFCFEGKSNFPTADVSVEGKWGNPERIWCFARASGRDAEYGGEKFGGFSLNVLVSPERIALYDVEITAESRSASGSIEWTYPGGGITSFSEQRIFLRSDLNPRELVALGGDDVSEVLEIVKFGEAPRISFGGILRNPRNNPGGLHDVFNATVDAPGETDVCGAKFYDSKFKARSDKIDTQIDDASFTFCGGSGGGFINLHKSGHIMEFDGSFHADKMNQASFTDFLYSLGSVEKDSKNASSGDMENVEKRKEHSKKSFVDGGENGFITMSISLKGDTSDIAQSVGGGYANVENAELIKLNLFGAVSRALSAMRLPFGSFDITYAYSPFEISDGTVKFTKLEMGGPVMRIKGAAAYNFVEDDIDASLTIRPFGGLTTPIVSSVVSIINPLTNAVQVSLDGSLSDPEVGVNVNPIKMLKSEKSLLKDIRDSL